MRNFTRVGLAALVAAILFGPSIVQMRSAGGSGSSGAVAQDVNIVSPLTNNGSVPVEATIKGLVKTRANPALTHVGALASDVVTLIARGLTSVNEVHDDGSISTLTVIPSGKALVITDLAWTASGNPGDPAFVQVIVGNITTYRATLVYQDSGKYDDNGNISLKASMTTGITFGPGTVPVFNTTTTMAIGPSDSTIYGLGSGQVIAQGYYLDTP